MKIQFSAGGVVFKRQATSDKRQAGILILVSQHSQHHGWVFPKGLIGDHVEKENKSAFAKGFGETKDEAALREVKEETGAEGKIIRALNPITYWFVMKGEKVRKTVYYYLMEYVSGDIAKHDREMEKVEWLPAGKVEERLTYRSDKIVWNEAKNLI